MTLYEITWTSVSRILNILCILFKIKAIFIQTLFFWFYMRVGTLLTCGKHLHERIISLRGKICIHKTRLTPPLLIEVHVPSQENEQSCTCGLGISILLLSAILIFDFGIVPKGVIFFAFHFILNYRLMRSNIIELTCRMGNRECLANATEKFRHWINNGLR